MQSHPEHQPRMYRHFPLSTGSANLVAIGAGRFGRSEPAALVCRLLIGLLAIVLRLGHVELDQLAR